jgi:hypothetical protein
MHPSEASAAAPQQPQQPEGPSNEQMVWEMLYNPRFSLPVAEAEAAWARAVGREEEPDEEVSRLFWFCMAASHLHRRVCLQPAAAVLACT